MSKPCIVSRITVRRKTLSFHRPKTFLLNDRVKYMAFDPIDPCRLMIHYVDGKSDELFYDRKPQKTMDVYNKIVQFLYSNGTLEDMDDAFHECAYAA